MPACEHTNIAERANIKTDAEFLQALLDAIIDPSETLEIISEWVDGDKSFAVSMMKFEGQ